jgi:hypothetical protein
MLPSEIAKDWMELDADCCRQIVVATSEPFLLPLIMSPLALIVKNLNPCSTCLLLHYGWTTQSEPCFTYHLYISSKI